MTEAVEVRTTPLIRRVIVTVSRTWSDWPLMRSVLHQVWLECRGEAVLVHGNNRRGDQQARDIWLSLGGRDEPHDAEWGRYGRSAGIRRNQLMVDLRADLCVSFNHNQSPGATHCALAAEKAGIPVRRLTQEAT
jgi:hypothetical protein